MESKIDYGHSLLQSRPNFAKALKDFETFLTATQDDLQRKFRILNEQRSNRKTSRNVKTYLTLQNFLLQKHVHRLNEFQTEILRRVSLIFANSGAKYLVFSLLVPSKLEKNVLISQLVLLSLYIF